jgi:RNA polymerase sigma factor (sigma-70 family)
VDDRAVACAIAAGDATGLAAAFGEYAPGLYTYCRSQLAEPADAADALQDTFVIASSRVAGLRDPGRLRAWLFAVARNECHGRLPTGVIAVARNECPGRLPTGVASARDEVAGMADAVADSSAGDGQVDLRTVVRAALAALSPADGEIIELNLRHGLDGADLADVLGVPAARAHGLVSRARSRFGTSLAIVANRAGRAPCPGLTAITVGRGGALTAPQRRRAERHVNGCLVCDRRFGQLSPARLVFLVPAPSLPAGLPGRIFRLTADAAPGVAAYRARIARGAEPFGAGGFPVQLITPSVPRWRGSRPTAAVAAAAAALAVLGGGGYFVTYTAGHGEPPRAAATGSPAPEQTGPSRSSRALAPLPASSPAPALAHTPSQSAPATPLSTTPALTVPIVTTPLVPTPARTSVAPATPPPTTPVPTTPPPMTSPPTTPAPPTTSVPTTPVPTTPPPTTPAPTTAPPTTPVPTPTSEPASSSAGTS